jgi:hypothetical protein
MKDGVLEGVDTATFVSHFGGLFTGHELRIKESTDGLLVQITVAGTDRRSPPELYYELQLAVSALPGGKLVPLASRQRGRLHIKWLFAAVYTYHKFVHIYAISVSLV